MAGGEDYHPVIPDGEDIGRDEDSRDEESGRREYSGRDYAGWECAGNSGMMRPPICTNAG